MNENESLYSESNIFLENRSKMRVTGVKDVDSFDDYNINVKTQKGDLIIGGEELKISKLDVESGELNIDGVINSLFYSEGVTQKKSMFGRLIK